MNSNADVLRKELENIRRSQEKLEHSFAEIQTELRAVKTRMNNAEEQICEDMGRTEFIDILNAKIIANSLTSRK